MQCFVKRTELVNSQPIIDAFFPDLPMQDRDLYGSDRAVLSLPDSARTFSQSLRMNQLTADWRNNAAQVVNDEAYRRITESFSEFMQRNAVQVSLRFTNLYGTDTSRWPAGPASTYSLCQQGWNYINVIRNASDPLIASMPTDPTDDANWPARISPIYIPTT